MSSSHRGLLPTNESPHCDDARPPSSISKQYLRRERLRGSDNRARPGAAAESANIARSTSARSLAHPMTDGAFPSAAAVVVGLEVVEVEHRHADLLALAPAARARAGSAASDGGWGARSGRRCAPGARAGRAGRRARSRPRPRRPAGRSSSRAAGRPRPPPRARRSRAPDRRRRGHRVPEHRPGLRATMNSRSASASPLPSATKTSSPGEGERRAPASPVSGSSSPSRSAPRMPPAPAPSLRRRARTGRRPAPRRPAGPSQTAIRAAVGSTLRASARVASVTASTSAARLGCHAPSGSGRRGRARPRAPGDHSLVVDQRHDPHPVVAARSVEWYSNERCSPRSAAPKWISSGSRWPGGCGPAGTCPRSRTGSRSEVDAAAGETHPQVVVEDGHRGLREAPSSRRCRRSAQRSAGAPPVTTQWRQPAASAGPQPP